ILPSCGYGFRVRDFVAPRNDAGIANAPPLGLNRAPSVPSFFLSLTHGGERSAAWRCIKSCLLAEAGASCDRDAAPCGAPLRLFFGSRATLFRRHSRRMISQLLAGGP